jgi:hypothetical protein
MHTEFWFESLKELSCWEDIAVEIRRVRNEK